MSELITTYPLSDSEKPQPMDREEFYAEQIKVFKKTGKPSRAAGVIQVLLFTPDKEIILQKRSADKRHNPNKIDKSIGGHVTWGDKPTFTVMAETLQELRVPSIVLDSDDDFKKTFKLLRQFLGNAAIIQLIDNRIDIFERVFDQGKIDIANNYHFYLGVYGGAVKPQDKEASGILYYRFDNLEKEIAQAPEVFTADLKFFLKKYKKEIKQFISDYLA